MYGVWVGCVQKNAGQSVPYITSVNVGLHLACTDPHIDHNGLRPLFQVMVVKARPKDPLLCPRTGHHEYTEPRSYGVFTPEQDNDKTTTRQMLNLCIHMMPFTPGPTNLVSCSGVKTPLV